MSETEQRPDALALFVASAPIQSACIVLAVLAAAISAIVVMFANPDSVRRELANPKTILELTGAGLTCAAATIAAFRIHVRGRTPAWRAVPLALFATWQTLSMYTALDVPLDKPAEQLLYGHSPDCFLFILAASIPISVVMFSTLSLHRSYMGWSPSAMTGLAISSAAVFLLQFFHDYDFNLGDWSIHFLAIGIVVGSSAYVGQLLPSRR